MRRCHAGLYTPAVYVYEKVVQEMGVSKAKASIILSILGIYPSLIRHRNSSEKLKMF